MPLAVNDADIDDVGISPPYEAHSAIHRYSLGLF